jgi:hypothetical protein
MFNDQEWQMAKLASRARERPYKGGANGSHLRNEIFCY